MNEYEVTKLRKQLQRSQDVIDELRSDLDFTERKLVEVQAERDRYHSQILLTRQSIESVDTAISRKIEEIRVQERKNFALKLEEYDRLKGDFELEKTLKQRLVSDIQVKDSTISELTSKLRDMARKHGDYSAAVNTAEIKENIAMNAAQYYKLTEKYNKLASDMENVIAENRILRKLHGVPDNFGFDLEDIKVAEKQELEDYKVQVKHLETELEELEAERTQLRYRLREYSSLYSNKGERYKDFSPQMFELLDAYALNLKEGNVELPQIDKSKKEMEKEIIKLRAQMELFQGKFPTGNRGDQNPQDIRKYHDEMKSILSPVLDSIQKALAKDSSISTTNNFNSRQSLRPNQLRQPMPLPSPTNDWQNLQEGMSFTLNSKIPVELKEIYGQTGFNTIQAKYEVALLQLHNIENMKILKEKDRIENELLRQIEYLKDQYKKFMLMQDHILVTHFQKHEQMGERIKEESMLKAEVEAEREQFAKRVNVLEDSYATLATKSPSELQSKVIQLTQRLAISEAETLKSQRKYKIISDEQSTLRKSYTQLEQKSSQVESTLRQKLLVTKRNQDLLSETLNTVLEDCKDNVSGENHSIIRSKLEITQDKYANLLLKQADLRKRIASLEGADRSSHLKQKTIDSLREDNSDLLLQMEIIKCRLSSFDGQFRRYEEIFGNFVKFVNSNNISALTFFKKFDKSGEGLLQKDELRNGFSALGFNMDISDFELMYSFIDLDGSGEINYREFLKKLRRAGVSMRTQEESGILKLYQAISDANFTLKRAFESMDRDSSNSISKAQMEQAMLRIGIPITKDTVDYIFRMVDNDMDNSINYSQFEKIFTSIVGQAEVEERTLFNTTLDWKYAVMLKIEECATKNNMTVIQAFELMDPDGSKVISYEELKTFFNKSGIEISNKNIQELFRLLDKDGSKTVRYNEFLELIREARKEKERIDRILFVKAREVEIRSQHEVADREVEFRVHEEASLKGRLMGMQLKQSHYTKKHELLVKELARREADIKDLKDALDLNQKSILKIQLDCYLQKEKNITLQQKCRGALSSKEVDKLKGRYNLQHLENVDIRTQLEVFKGVSDIFNTRMKESEKHLGRVEEEKEKFYELVKDFQSKSDVNALVGKLTHELEQSKWEQNGQNERQERIVFQMKEMKVENLKMVQQVEAKDKEIISTHLFFREKSAMQQRNIDNLSGMILPTVTLSKVEGLAIKLRELSQGRSELEEQNRKLRQGNFELELRNDQLESDRTTVEELERKLRKLYQGDENAINIIDLSKRLSQYKIVELRCKRESVLLKEKEDYYTRIHHTNQDTIKELQEELAKWETKFALAEDSWRKKLADQAKLAESLKVEQTKQKDTENYFFAKRNQQAEADKQLERKLSLLEQPRLKKMNISQLGQNPSLEKRLVEVEHENDELRLKLQDLLSIGKNLPHMVDYSVQGSQVMSQSINMQTDLTVSQLRNNANRFIKTAQNRQQFYQHESEKLAQAAQQSIATLQGIIDDKNEQIRRKDKLIQDLKNDFLRAKEEDTVVIQHLNEKLFKQTSDGLGETPMRETTRVGGRKHTDGKFHELQRELEEKDRRIRDLEYHNQTHAMKTSKFRGDDDLKRLQNKIRDLQNQKDLDEKSFKAIEDQLRRKIANLQKLSKEKDIKLTKLQKSLSEIKSQIIGENKHVDEAYENLQSKVGGGMNPNNSQLQIHLQKAMDTIRAQKTKLEDLGSEIKAKDQVISSLKEQVIPRDKTTAIKRPSSIRK